MAAHNNADTIMPMRNSKGRRLQSAIEFLTTYGFALLVLSIAIALVLVLANFPQSTVPPTCTFPGYVNCITVAIGSNALGSRVVLLLSNPQQFALQSVSASINISGLGIYTGPCTPNFVLSGGDASCTINSGNKVTPNQLAKGTITITASVCTQVSQSGCGSPVTQTYTGQFIAHVSPYVPSPQCTIKLSAQNSTVYYSTGVADPLMANVKILGYNIAGASVNYTYSGSNIISLAPQYINTGTNGNAISYAYGENTGSSTITATYSTCSASNTINSVAPIYISFTADGTISPIPKTSIIVAVNNIQYSLQQLPAVWPSDPGNPHSYLYYPYPVSPGERIGPDIISGTCGVTANPGTVSSSVDCNVIAHYNYQYYLTVMADPGEGGSTTPSGSEWLDAGTVQPITATNAIGFTFSDWSGTGSGSYTGTSASSSVTMDGPITENAVFSLVVNPQASPSSPYALDLIGAGDSIPSDPTGAFTVLSGSGSPPYYGLGGTHPYTYSWSSSCPGFVNPGTTAPSANAFAYIPTGSTAGCDFGLTVQDSYTGYGGAATGSGTTQTIIVNPALSASTGITCYSLGTGGTSLTSVSCTSAFDYAGQNQSNANKSQTILAPVSENSSASNSTPAVAPVTNLRANNSTETESSKQNGSALAYSNSANITPMQKAPVSYAAPSNQDTGIHYNNAPAQHEENTLPTSAFPIFSRLPIFAPPSEEISVSAQSYSGTDYWTACIFFNNADNYGGYDLCSFNGSMASATVPQGTLVQDFCMIPYPLSDDYTPCSATSSYCTDGTDATNNPISYTNSSGATWQFNEWGEDGYYDYDSCYSDVSANVQSESDWVAYGTYTPPPPVPITVYSATGWTACVLYGSGSSLCANNGGSSTADLAHGTYITGLCAYATGYQTCTSCSSPYISNAGTWTFSDWTSSGSLGSGTTYTPCQSQSTAATGSGETWTLSASYTNPVSLTVAESPAGAASQWYACMSYLEPSGSVSASSYACAGPSTSSSETVYVASGTTATNWCVGGTSCEAYQASSCTGSGFTSYTWSYWIESGSTYENSDPCDTSSQSLSNTWTAEFNSIGISATSSTTDMIPYESSTVQDTTTGATSAITYVWSDTGNCPSYTSQSSSYFTYTPTYASGSSTTYSCTFNAESEFSQSCGGYCTYSYDPTASTNPAISIFQPYVDVSASPSGGTEYAASPYYSYSWAVASGTSCPNFASPGDVSSFVYYPTDTSDTALTCKFSATISDDAYYPEYYTSTTSAIDITPATGSGTASTTTAISCSPTSFSTSSSTTCTATVSGGTGTITGTVSFTTTSSHGTFTGSPCTLSATSPYTCSVTYSDTSTGSPTLTATYSGNNPGSSGTAIVTVTSGGSSYYPITIDMSPSATSTSWEACVAFYLPNYTTDGNWKEQCIGAQRTGWGAPLPGDLSSNTFELPSGSTIIDIATNSLSSTYSFSDWSGSYSTSNPTAGAEGVGPSGSGSLDLSVTGTMSFQANYGSGTATTTTVTCSPNPITTMTPSTCTATVTGSSPTGTVSFTTNTPSTGTFTPTSCTLPASSPYSCSVSYRDTAAGNKLITATYSGDAHNLGSSGGAILTVDQTEQVTLAETPTGSTTTGSTTTQNAYYYYAFCLYGSYYPMCVGGTGGSNPYAPSANTFYIPYGSTIDQYCIWDAVGGSDYSLYNETNIGSAGASSVNGASQFAPYSFYDDGTYEGTADCESVSVDVNQNYVETLNFGYNITVRANPDTAPDDDADYYEMCANGHTPGDAAISVCAGGLDDPALHYPAEATVTLPAGSTITQLCNYTSASGYTDTFHVIVNNGEYDGSTDISQAYGYTLSGGCYSGLGIDINEPHVEVFDYQGPPAPTYTLTIEGQNPGGSPSFSASVCNQPPVISPVGTTNPDYVDYSGGGALSASISGTTIITGCGTYSGIPAGTSVEIWDEYVPWISGGFCGWVGSGGGAYGNPYGDGCGSLGDNVSVYDIDGEASSCTSSSGGSSCYQYPYSIPYAYEEATITMNSDITEVATELPTAASSNPGGGSGDDGDGGGCGGDGGGCS